MENLIKYFGESSLLWCVVHFVKWPQIEMDEHWNIINLIFYTPNYMHSNRKGFVLCL